MIDIPDITLIGSGAAATTTLIELFLMLLANPLKGNILNISVVEKHPEFWKGIPYGSRSSLNSLTITAVSDFISNGKERELFLSWLKKNHNHWTYYYRENGGLAAKIWLEKNLPLLENNEWHAVYLPRFVFGVYMHDKMLNLLKMVEEKKLVQLTLIQAEAIDVSPKDTYYDVKLESPEKRISNLKTKKL